MNKRFQLVLKNLKDDAILISNPTDIFYLTGFNGFSKEEKEAYVLLTKKCGFIFTDGRYSEVVKNEMPYLKLIEINPLNNFEMGFSKTCKSLGLKNISVNLNDLNLREYKKIKRHVKLVDDQNLIGKLRETKDELEIKNLKTACALGDKVFKYILTQVKIFVSEIDLAKKIEIFILQNNASISFSPIVAFGANSSSPHHISTNKKLAKNQIVLLDFGVKINGYCSDMTRTVFFGSAKPEFKRMYKTVLESQQKAIEYINNQSSIVNNQLLTSSIDKTAREYIISQGFPTIPHSLGHGIGIEVHESPRLSLISKDILKKGNVFSIEPGIYIPGFGGVRIEDLFYYNGKNAQLISHANKGIIEL